MRAKHPIRLYAGAVMGAGFIGLAIAILASPMPFGFDLAITGKLQQAIPGGGVVAGVILQGHSAVTIPLLLALLLTVLALRQWTALLLAPLGLLGYLVAGIVKEMTQRPRPSADLVQVFSDPGGWSFPSHTAAGTTILLGLLVYFLWRALEPVSGSVRSWGRSALVTMAGVIFVWQNVSSLYAGRHWATDVIGAWLLGGAWLILLIGVWEWWEGRRSRGVLVAERLPRPSE